MNALRSGLPALSDVLGNLRLHCDQVADGELPRAQHAWMVEFDAAGVPTIRHFGTIGNNYEARAALKSAAKCLQELRKRVA